MNQKLKNKSKNKNGRPWNDFGRRRKREKKQAESAEGIASIEADSPFLC